MRDDAEARVPLKAVVSTKDHAGVRGIGPADTRPAKTAAVIGAGLSGLTAAYRLQEAGWHVDVFESESEVGGRTKSVRAQGYLVDTGASALPESYTAYIDLTSDLGVRDRVVPASPYIGILRDGHVHLLDLGHMVRSGLSTKLLSWQAKVKLGRLGKDLILAKSRGQLVEGDLSKAAPLDTETARTYALRALSEEIDSYLCEPIVRTMLIANTDKVSKVELFNGLANAFNARIYAVEGGVGYVPHLLASHLNITLEAEVTNVSERGSKVVLELNHEGQNQVRDYDVAVISTPLPIATAICPDRADLLNPLNQALGYTQAITVGVGTRVRPDNPAMLLQLPSVEDPEIGCIFLEHNKAPDRAPAGRALFGCCWETSASGKWMSASDEQIVEQSVRSLHRAFPEITSETVEFSHVTRWNRALVFTKMGAYRRIGEFHAALNPHDRIQFAADYMSNPGQNTAVVWGNRTAERVIAAHGVR